MFWQVYKNLEEEVINLSKYISITDSTLKIDNKTKTLKRIENGHQLEVYSPFIADLLIRCCVEIEAISKEMYFEAGGVKQRGSSDVYFDTDCISFLNHKWNICIKKVIVSSIYFDFKNEENLSLTPLLNADKRSKTYWAKCYQAVKHDRYNSLYLGNIKALIQAMAALYLLNIYYKDIKLSSKYFDYRKLDFSFGSKLFSLKLPDERYIIDVVNGKEFKDTLHSSDSPYILKYTDSTYKQVIEATKLSVKDRQDYILKQPEMNEPEFLEILKESKAKEKIVPGHRLMLIWELSKYRLNKKIPPTLPFEERKKRFVSSAEWFGHIRQINNPKNENEITEDNIQAEIDHAAIQYGMEIEQKFENPRFCKAFTEGVCELVLDKGNIRYNDK